MCAWGADVMLLSPGTVNSALLAQALAAPLQAWLANGVLQGVALLLVLGVAPAVWLWRMPVRRLSLRRTAQHNGVLLAVCAAVFNLRQPAVSPDAGAPADARAVQPDEPGAWVGPRTLELVRK